MHEPTSREGAKYEVGAFEGGSEGLSGLWSAFEHGGSPFSSRRRPSNQLQSWKRPPLTDQFPSAHCKTDRGAGDELTFAQRFTLPCRCHGDARARATPVTRRGSLLLDNPMSTTDETFARRSAVGQRRRDRGGASLLPRRRRATVETCLRASSLRNAHGCSPVASDCSQGDRVRVVVRLALIWTIVVATQAGYGRGRGIRCIGSTPARPTGRLRLMIYPVSIIRSCGGPKACSTSIR